MAVGDGGVAAAGDLDTCGHVTRAAAGHAQYPPTWTWIVMGVAGGDVSRDFLTLLLFILDAR